MTEPLDMDTLEVRMKLATPEDQMPMPYDEDRRYSDRECERLEADKRIRSVLPELIRLARIGQKAEREGMEIVPGDHKV